MLDIVQAVAGWAITWLIIIALPTLGVAIGKWILPQSVLFDRFMGVVGFFVAAWTLTQMPQPPATTKMLGWVAEYKFHFNTYHQTYTGLAQAVATLGAYLSSFNVCTKQYHSNQPHLPKRRMSMTNEALGSVKVAYNCGVLILKRKGNYGQTT